MPSSRSLNPSRMPVAVIGLGLMGTSIATCLLAAGHPVIGLDVEGARRRAAPRKIREYLRQMRRERLLRGQPAAVARRFAVAASYARIADSVLVIEATTEDLGIKREVVRQVEAVVSPGAMIATNTSGLPVSDIQRAARYPGRVLGLHWAEPAHITRFMEVICGNHTAHAVAEEAVELAQAWGKEPSLLRRDIRGFITNRIMYAMLREAFYLVENGYASIADVDRSLRNDLGYWITFAGPFRFMDLTGIPAYATVMQDLLPELSCQKRAPRLIRKLVASGARGVSNARGFYSYTADEARRWEHRFVEFTYDIRKLALRYAVDDRKTKTRK